VIRDRLIYPKFSYFSTYVKDLSTQANFRLNEEALMK